MCQCHKGLKSFPEDMPGGLEARFFHSFFFLSLSYLFVCLFIRERGGEGAEGKGTGPHTMASLRP